MFGNIFLKKRFKATTGAPFTHVPGNMVTNPGAEGFAYEPTVSNPGFLTQVIPAFNFRPPNTTHPPMVVQLLSLPQSPLQGFVFEGLKQSALMDESTLPDVQGSYYQ